MSAALLSSPLRRKLQELERLDADRESGHLLTLSSLQQQSDDQDDDDEDDDDDDDDEYQTGYNLPPLSQTKTLHCSLCGTRVPIDSFSAQQAKVQEDCDRFCLSHTGTSSYGATYRRQHYKPTQPVARKWNDTVGEYGEEDIGDCVDDDDDDDEDVDDSESSGGGGGVDESDLDSKQEDVQVVTSQRGRV